MKIVGIGDPYIPSDVLERRLTELKEGNEIEVFTGNLILFSILSI